MLSKRVAQNFTIGMQKDIVLPIIVESLQIAEYGSEHYKSRNCTPI
ncbi:hypothetical protein T36_0044 [Helicobacter cinaedi]|nr:hypothetical protein [Helicobacter cinaedi]BDB63609.1 hypothetical protein T36_0044 [Helicobacter cinaedi]